MKKISKVTQEGIDVNIRFFSAIDELIANKQLHSFRDFVNRYSLNYGNLYITKHYPEKNNVKVEQLVYLTRDFNVNPTWLLLGTGKMLNKN